MVLVDPELGFNAQQVQASEQDDDGDQQDDTSDVPPFCVALQQAHLLQGFQIQIVNQIPCA